jgi:hypothetical protein
MDRDREPLPRPLVAHSGLAEPSLEEAFDQKGVEIDIPLKSKVAGIDEVEIDIFEVFRIRQSAGWREERVIPALDHQRRWLMLAEIRLPERILCKVVAVVVEQVELDLCIAWTVEKMLVERPGVGANQLRVACASDILKLGKVTL